MNKNTMNWTDNKVENSNMQRPSQTANEQYFMDIRTMPNVNTYGDNVQGMSNSQGTLGAQIAQPKNQQTMPMQMSNQMQNQDGYMPQGVRGDYFVNPDNAGNVQGMSNSQGTLGAQSAQPKKQQNMNSQMSNPMPQDTPMVQSTRMDSFLPSDFEQGPPPVMDREYIAGYLNTQIGKRVRAEFAISTGLYLDKTGILKEVGVNYFVLEDLVTRANIMCDLYSVRFVTTI